jgi:hypothetical protein
VDGNRAHDLTARGSVDADAAAGMEQAPFFGEKRRHLSEQFPFTGGFLINRPPAGVGQLEREAAHQRPGSVVQLD